MWPVLLSAGAAVALLVRWRRSGQSLGDFLGVGVIVAYGRLWHGCRGTRRLPLPAKGPALVCANHTCSADPAFLQARSRRVLSFFMAREYYHAVPFLRPLFDHMGCVLVNRRACDVAGARAGLRRLREGRVVCIFPEGGLSGAGRGRLRPAKGGLAWLALRSRAPVYPVFITGGPQHCDVPRAWLRPSRARLYPGRAIDLSAYYDRKITRPLLEEVSAYLMRQLAALDPSRRKPS